VILGVSLVETVWVGSKATRERVEGVVVLVVLVLVLVLVLVPVDHGGYYDDHFHYHDWSPVSKMSCRVPGDT